MADKEVGDLTAASALAAANSFHLLQSGNSREATMQQVLDFMRASFSGARVKFSADLLGVNYSSSTTLSWGTEVIDAGGWWAAGSPTIFTVPAGISHLEAGGHVHVGNLTGDVTAWLDANISGSGFTDRLDIAYATDAANAANSAVLVLNSGPMAVSSGDTFRMRFLAATDTSINILAARAVFWIRGF